MTLPEKSTPHGQIRKTPCLDTDGHPSPLFATVVPNHRLGRVASSSGDGQPIPSLENTIMVKGPVPTCILITQFVILTCCGLLLVALLFVPSHVLAYALVTSVAVVFFLLFLSAYFIYRALSALSK